MRAVAATVAMLWLIGPLTAAVDAPRGEAPAAEGDRRPRVLVLPFEELSDAPRREWVGKAMQQSLVAELTRSGLVSVVTPPADATHPKDAAEAAKLAREMHAPLVITGAYQLVDQELRVTGQMLESIEGEPVSGIKATGNLRDLFGIEDIIGNQLRRDLQAILQPPSTTQPSQGDPFRVQPTGPVQALAPGGIYDGSNLQRSLDDRWTAPVAPGGQGGYDRNPYGYPTAPLHPAYSYYDWCGYGSWPTSVRRVVPPGPGKPTPLTPNNNYVTSPGQVGRPSGGNHIQGHPGQMGRQSGGNVLQGAPGQMGRSGSANTQRNASR